MNTLWSKYPFLRYFLIYLLGTLSYHWADLRLDLFAVLAPLPGLIICFFLPPKIGTKLLEIRTLSLVYLFFAWGNYNNTDHDLLTKSNHIHSLDYSIYFGQIVSDKTEKSKHKSFVLDVLFVKTGNAWEKAVGKVVLYLPKNLEIEYNDYLLIRGYPHKVQAPTNPAQFDYASYLRFKNIYDSHYLVKDTTKIYPLQNTDFSLLKYIYRMRQHCHEKIKTYVDRDLQGFAASLLLGLRGNLEEDIIVNFRRTGVFHVLAISGLHVGIIYGLLITLLSSLRYRKPLLFIVLVGSSLWFYAFFSGLSISVTRATCMFSFLLVGLVLKRQAYNFNSLALSALVILTFRPFAIFEVGFQLSYIAVSSIFIFMPLLKPYFYRGSNRILKYISELVKVCLAAQMGLLPMLLYYFHLFPTYFIIANILIIPLITVALLLGLIFFIPFYFEIINKTLAETLSFTLRLADSSTAYLSNLPGATIDGFNPPVYILPICYLGLAMLLAFYRYKQFKYLLIGFGLFLIVNLERFNRVYRLKNNTAIVVYDTPWPALAFIESNKATLILDEKLLKRPKTVTFLIKPYFEYYNFQEVDTFSFASENWKAMRHIGENRLFVHLDKKIMYLRKPIKERIAVDYLILANPNLNFQNIDYERLIVYNSKTILEGSHSIRHAGAWTSSPLLL